MNYSTSSEVHFKHYAFYLHQPIPLCKQLLLFCPGSGYGCVYAQKFYAQIYAQKMCWQLKWVTFDPFPVMIDLIWEGTQARSQKHKGLSARAGQPGKCCSQQGAHTRQRTCSLFKLYNLKHSSVSTADISITS